jgi:hypothetical protein
VFFTKVVDYDGKNKEDILKKVDVGITMNPLDIFITNATVEMLCEAGKILAGIEYDERNVPFKYKSHAFS